MCSAKHKVKGLRRKTQHIFMGFEVHTALRTVHNIVRGFAVLRCRCILCGSL